VGFIGASCQSVRNATHGANDMSSLRLSDIQRVLLNAEIPAKFYVKDNGLIIRVRFRDRKKAKLTLAPYFVGAKLTYRYTLTPWECRSLLKVVAYVD
jgi:hypothetical protein